ncbi:MAG: DUF6624 domain-containing protein [Bacteroidota bacterium]
MKRFPLLLLSGFCFLGSTLLAQNYVSDDPAYKENILCAQEALEAKDYATCAECYEKALAITQKSPYSLIMAASCFSMNQEAEKAFPYIFTAIKQNWDQAEYYLNFVDGLEGVKASPQWAVVLDSLKARRIAYESTLNMPLKRELDSMMVLDQKYRKMMDSVSTEFGWQSPEMSALWAKQNAVDSSNTIRIEEIIAEHGYPGKSLVGDRSGEVAFFVIQHAELDIQEKYLDMMSEAADAGEVKWSLIAMLVDRVRMRQGKTQLYGSQVTRDSTGKSMFHPIEDEANVNVRRSKVGLGPLEDYAKHFGFEYHLPKKDKEGED